MSSALHAEKDLVLIPDFIFRFFGKNLAFEIQVDKDWGDCIYSLRYVAESCCSSKIKSADHSGRVYCVSHVQGILWGPRVDCVPFYFP